MAFLLTRCFTPFGIDLAEAGIPGNNDGVKGGANERRVGDESNIELIPFASV
jgi:hypothetical protein